MTFPKVLPMLRFYTYPGHGQKVLPIWEGAGKASSTWSLSSCSNFNSGSLCAMSWSPWAVKPPPRQRCNFLEKARSAGRRQLRLQFRQDSWNSLGSKGHAQQKASPTVLAILTAPTTFTSDYTQTTPHDRETAWKSSTFLIQVFSLGS